MSQPTTKWKIAVAILSIIILFSASFYMYRNDLFGSNFEITDDLEGNIFPSSIISLATTDTIVINPADSTYLGNPKSSVAIRLTSKVANSKVRIKLSETPFYEESISDFILENADTEYLIYPDVIWKYDMLKQNNQPTPTSVVAQVTMNHKDLGQKVKTFSVRSINECLLAYVDKKQKFHETGIFFAAYVNEDNPIIDKILREALDTRIVNRFSGYQANEENVTKQVYALWNVLQKRNFKYSSISATSLSSNIVFSQRVRTIDDALDASQINCVDGSVLFASLLRAINLDPILVRTPQHVFVGYYLNKKHTKKDFLETTMIGDVNLDDFFPEEQLDSTKVGKSQNEISLLTFNKSKEYANQKYEDNLIPLQKHERFYMFLEISKNIRKKIQPIGK